jgi:hypothetical protein
MLVAYSESHNGITSYSGPVYTMDHEVGLGLCKAVGSLLKLSRDNFGLHQEKNGRGAMEVEVSKI